MNRDFAQWLSKLKTHIQDFKYFVDFKTVKANANVYKKELNLMNSLIGESNIEDKYEELINEYPQVLKCIPILLAVRTREIDVWRGGDNYSKY
jgi:type II restriction enzyme